MVDILALQKVEKMDKEKCLSHDKSKPGISYNLYLEHRDQHHAAVVDNRTLYFVYTRHGTGCAIQCAVRGLNTDT